MLGLSVSMFKGRLLHQPKDGSFGDFKLGLLPIEILLFLLPFGLFVLELGAIGTVEALVGLQFILHLSHFSFVRLLQDLDDFGVIILLGQAVVHLFDVFVLLRD